MYEMKEIWAQLSKVRIIPPECAELFRGRVFISTAASWLSKACRNLIKGTPLGFGHLEVGEDEEAHQENSEDDEDIGTTELLKGEKHQCSSWEYSTE